jgi:hypothetical protein
VIENEIGAGPSAPLKELAGFELAGAVGARATNLLPGALPPGRSRHAHGTGPFAKLIMPALPDLPGLYLWVVDNEVMYIGQTRTPLRNRLGATGYSSISNYNTFARQPDRRNGGQQTNCRINAIANAVIVDRRSITIWYRVTPSESTQFEESNWMRNFGIPPWNRRDER